MDTHSTREAWLDAAVLALADTFTAAGETLPPVRVSVGWPGGRGKKDTVIGQCWKAAASADRKAQIFISPVLDDGVRVLDVLAHELVHAVDNGESGHRGRFAKIARAIGLEGPLTATHAGETLKGALTLIHDGLGAYPHAALTPALAGGKTQTTRMLKVVCPEDDYTVRTTAKWLAMGVPTCPCGTEMQQAV